MYELTDVARAVNLIGGKALDSKTKWVLKLLNVFLKR
jgi:hypothetical protein